MLRYRLALLGCAAAASLVAGCGGEREQESSPPAAVPTATAEPAHVETSTARARKPPRRRTTIKATDSQFGTILGNGRGQAVYVFDEEQSSKPECYGDCARAWPPVLTQGRPRAGKGARKALLGTTRRRGGKRQVTYRGRPLYYYVADAPDRVLCHNVEEFGGLWLVIKPDGTPVD
jgi:predicted lipoprotein with Yx(FWY)xxD motif